MSAYEISLPTAATSNFDQDEEWFEIEIDGDRRRMRIHDYGEIFAMPGLYEQLLDDELRCSSPRVMARVLATLVDSEDEEMVSLRVLDVGAGNGKLGEELALRGVASLTGVDIIPEAAQATERDRPGLYEDYFVMDLADMTPDVRSRLEGKRFNCFTLVAALSFDEVPPRAFAEAYNLAGNSAWIAFNVKRDVLQQPDDGDIGSLVTRMVREGVMEQRAAVRYRHRLSVTGDPLFYVALVGRKRADLPLDWVED